MYTSKNFKSKKALKDAIKAGEKISVYDPGPFGNGVENGTAYLEGPWYPEPHKWYGQAKVKDGFIVSVK